MIINQDKNIEKEIKFKISVKMTKSELNQFLKRLGLRLKVEFLQKDVYWDNKDCEIINLKRGLRIRYILNKIKDVEFKSLFKNDKGQYIVEEIKLFKNEKLDISALGNILVNRLGIFKLEDIKNSNLSCPEVYLSNLGLLPAITFEKFRKVWIDPAGEIEVSVDIIPDLGTFVEIEQVSNSKQFFDQIVEKFEKSKFAIRDIAYSGYLDLLLNKNDKIISKSEFEKKFREDNKWNVKSGEEDIFLSLTQ